MLIHLYFLPLKLTNENWYTNWYALSINQFVIIKSNLIEFCLVFERLISRWYQFEYQFIFSATEAGQWKLMLCVSIYSVNYTSPSHFRHFILKNALNRLLLKKLIRKAYKSLYQFEMRDLETRNQNWRANWNTVLIYSLKANLTQCCPMIERLNKIFGREQNSWF